MPACHLVCCVNIRGSGPPGPRNHAKTVVLTICWPPGSQKPYKKHNFANSLAPWAPEALRQQVLTQSFKKAPWPLSSKKVPDKKRKCIGEALTQAPPQSFKKGSGPLGFQKRSRQEGELYWRSLVPSSATKLQKGFLAIWAPKRAPNKKGNCIGGVVSQLPPPERQ